MILTLAIIPLGVLLITSVWDGMWERELPDCDGWSFDAEAWEAEATRDDEALALVRCDALAGMSRSEVVALLGARDRAEDGHRWRYGDGLVHDAVGPGDAQSLFVRFNRRDRVQNVSLLYGGDQGMATED